MNRLIHKAVLLASVAAVSFAVNVSAQESTGYKLPSRSSLITIPSATTPYRLRYMTDCSDSPSTCLIDTTSLFTAWMDSGSPYDYTSWVPEPLAQVSDFLQSRDYQQDQIQFEQQRYRHKETGEFVNNGSPLLHEQTVTRDETRPVSVSYTGWVNNGSNHSCDNWSPETDTVKWGESFTQLRGCLEPQIQYRVYTAYGDEIGRQTELQNVGDQESQPAVGTLDYITQTIMGTPPAWTDFGKETCGEWSPDTDTVWEDTELTQNRDCVIGQQRDVTYWDQWASGVADTENRTERETQNREWEDAQVVIGTKTLWMAASDDFSIWVNDGEYSATTWAPAPNAQSSDYVQSRTKTQPQTRDKYTREKNQRDGSYRTVATTEEYRDVNTSESRTVDVSQSSWANTTVSSQTSWTPALAKQQANFTQTRGYTQNQSATRYHKVDGATIYTKALTQSLTNQSESRNVVASVGSYGAYGTGYSYSDFTPAYGAQTSAYTRTQTYKADRSRLWTYKVNGVSIGTSSETQTSTLTNSQAVAVTWSGWTDSGSHYSCGSWSPDLAGYWDDEQVTQTRSCKQAQTGTYTHKVNGSTVYTNAKSQTISENETQVKYGTKTRYVVASQSTCDATVTYGTATYSTWSPAAGTQQSNYSQSRNKSQPRRAYCYNIKTDNKTGATSKVNGSYSEKTALVTSESRTVSVAKGSWEWISGTDDSYSSWTPTFASKSSSTADYSQTRTYKQDQRQKVTHTASGSTIHTFYLYQYDISRTSSARTVDVAQDTSWANSGSLYNCSSTYVEYGSSTQLRAACSQNQTAKYGHYVSGTRMAQYTHTKTVTGYKYKDKPTLTWQSFSAYDGYSREIPRSTVTLDGTCTTEGEIEAYRYSWYEEYQEYYVRYAKCQ